MRYQVIVVEEEEKKMYDMDDLDALNGILQTIRDFATLHPKFDRTIVVLDENANQQVMYRGPISKVETLV